MKAKRIIKDVAIVLFVLLAVGVAGLLFYRFVVKRNIDKVNVVAMAIDNSESELLNKIRTIDLIMNADGTDSRLEDITSTIKSLDNSMQIITAYYFDESVVSDDTVKKMSVRMQDDVVLFGAMYDEYLEKAKDKTYFPVHEGANDIVNTLADYVVSYSKLVLRLNKKLDTLGLDRSADVKFCLIDLYASVALDTYSNLNELNYTTRLTPKVSTNLAYCNKKIKITSNSVEGLELSRISSKAALLGRYYFSSDSSILARDLVTLMDTVTQETSTKSNENMTAYLLRQVVGR